MILRSFIILDVSKYDDLPDVDIPEGAYIGYKITSTSMSAIDKFYKKVFLSPRTYRFCLLIDLDNDLCEVSTEPDSVLDFLVSFTFHSNYLKTNHDNPVVLVEIGRITSDMYIPVIRQAFKSHGYDDIQAMIIGDDDGSLFEHYHENIRFDLNKNFECLPSKYLSAIKKVSSAQSFFSFFLEYPGDIPMFLNIIKETEIVIRKDLPQIYSLLTENGSLNIEENKLMSKLELLQEEINSLNNYHLNYNLTITRYKSQVAELMKFYKNEYEILPTWYKRLGHIVKVLMGKRTFRSLFDHNVNKYKD